MTNQMIHNPTLMEEEQFAFLCKFELENDDPRSRFVMLRNIAIWEINRRDAEWKSLRYEAGHPAPEEGWLETKKLKEWNTLCAKKA